MTVQSPDLISELLRGMRLSGVKYRRIEASAPFGVAFHQAAGRAQFHFVSHGSALLRMESGATFELSGGDALFIPGGNSHALLSDEQATLTPVNAFPSEPICSSVCAITCEPCPESGHTRTKAVRCPVREPSCAHANHSPHFRASKPHSFPQHTAVLFLYLTSS